MQPPSHSRECSDWLIHAGMIGVWRQQKRDSPTFLRMPGEVLSFPETCFGWDYI